jgi:hypothetical protein
MRESDIMAFDEALRIGEDGIDKKQFLEKLKEKGYKITLNKVVYDNVEAAEYGDVKLGFNIKNKLLQMEDEKYRFTLLINGLEYKEGKDIKFELYRTKKGSEYRNNEDLFFVFDSMKYFIRSLTILRHEIPENIDTVK